MTRRARILLVEDHPGSRELAEVILERAGYEVIAAADGETGLATARELHPDLIVMDVNLPGLDGLEVTRRLKAQPSTWEIPVLAVTAYAMRGDEERVLAAGCNGYLTKPIDRQLLLSTVARLLPQEAHQA
jgi:two-component system, cell cycle response regulator DivK